MQDTSSPKSNIREAAITYRDNHHSVPLRLRGKKPVEDEWQKRTLADPVPRFEPGDNIGILLGKPSGNLVRLDPDFQTVPAVTAMLFPELTAIMERKSSPRSGRFYICDTKKKNYQLSDVMAKDPRLPLHDSKPSLMVYQILSSGAQTVAPPSIHPSGEEVVWVNPGVGPHTLGRDALLYRVGLEAFCMAVRHFWPPRPKRNVAAIALSRVLLEALAPHIPDEGRRIKFVDDMVVEIAMAGGDGEASREGKQRAAETLRKMNAGEETIGLPALCELLGLPEVMIKEFREWLGIGTVDVERSLVVELAIKLWGEPTGHKGTEYKFGNRTLDARWGSWFDFEQNVGGNLRELMKLAGSSAAPKLGEVVCAANIPMRPHDWMWEGHLLRGALELLSGIPGLGKSQVQIHYIACATARLPWPDRAPPIKPVNVIMVTAEDTLDQDVVPRLVAAGADLKRVFILKYIKTDPKTQRQFLLADDLEQLEKQVAQIGNVGLITIDPITAYMGGKIDSHKSTEVRSQLGPLKDFAERVNVAVSAITHPPKNASAKAIDHFIGSQAFVAAARTRPRLRRGNGRGGERR